MNRFAVAASAVILSAVSLPATVTAGQPAAPAAQNQRPSPPATADQHLSAAKGYRDQAVKERRVAEMHRFMIQRRREEPGQVAPSDWYYEHCQKLIDAAEELARAATELAEYHEKTARELRTKAAR